MKKNVIELFIFYRHHYKGKDILYIQKTHNWYIHFICLNFYQEVSKDK